MFGLASEELGGPRGIFQYTLHPQHLVSLFGIFLFYAFNSVHLYPTKYKLKYCSFKNVDIKENVNDVEYFH